MSNRSNVVALTVDNTRARRLTNLEHAKLYIKAGLYVFPSSGKVPLVPRFNKIDTEITPEDREAAIEEYEADNGRAPVHVGATKNPAVLKEMFKRHMDCVWSIACGPSKLVVIDADSKDNGPELIGEHFETHGLPEGCVVVPTQSGGRHYIFKDPEGKYTNSAGALKSEYGCDVRGKGGQYISPGSIREDGKTYGTRKDAIAFLKAYTAGTLPELPDHVAELIGTGGEAAQSIAESEYAPIIRDLEQTDWPDYAELFDPIIGTYDLEALKAKSPEFAEAFDNPNDDKSTARWKLARAVLEQARMPAVHLAVLYEGWGQGGARTDDGKGSGNYSLRDIAKEWRKNKDRYQSDGSVMGNVEDDDDMEDGNEVDDTTEAATDTATAKSKKSKASKERPTELELYKEALAAAGVKAKSNSASKSGLMTAFDHRRAFAPQDELIEGLWPVRGLCSVFGDSNSGKTFFTLAAGKAIAAGRRFNGCDTIKAGVLYIGCEGREGTDGRMEAAYRHLNESEIARGLDPEDFKVENAADTVHTSFDFPAGMSLKAACARFYKLACDYKALRGSFPSLIIIDHIVALLPPGTDMYSPTDMQSVSAALTELYMLLDNLVVTLGHENKQGGFMGSVMQRAGWTRAIQIEREGEGGESAIHHIKINKWRDGLPGGTSRKFWLVTRETGVTPRGKLSTSAVVSFEKPRSSMFPAVSDEEADAKLSDATRLAEFDTIEEYLVDHMGRSRAAAADDVTGTKFMAHDLREAVTPALDYYAGRTDRTRARDPAKLAKQRRVQLARAFSTLEERGRVKVELIAGRHTIVHLLT